MDPLWQVITAIQDKQDAIQMACNAHGPYGIAKPLAMVDKTLALRLSSLIIGACDNNLEQALDIVRQMPIDYVGKWRFDVRSMSWIICDAEEDI